MYHWPIHSTISQLKDGVEPEAHLSHPEICCPQFADQPLSNMNINMICMNVWMIYMTSDKYMICMICHCATLQCSTHFPRSINFLWQWREVELMCLCPMQFRNLIRANWGPTSKITLASGQSSLAALRSMWRAASFALLMATVSHLNWRPKKADESSKSLSLSHESWVSRKFAMSIDK